VFSSGRLINMTIDLVALFAAATLATYVRFGSLDALVAIEGIDTDLRFWVLGAIVSVFWTLLLSMDRSESNVAGDTSEQLGITQVTRVLSVGFVGFIVLTYAFKISDLSRGWTLLLWTFGIIFVLLGRGVVASYISWQRTRGRYMRRTLLVGSNSEASDLVRILDGAGSSGLVPVGCLASSQAERLSLDFCADTLPMMGVARDICSVIREQGIEVVIIASSAFDHEVLARMIAELRGVPVEVHISSGLFEVLTSRVLVREVAGVPLITIRGVPLSKGKLAFKRFFDIVVSSLILLIGMPIWIMVMLGIKLTSRGPVFYTQDRVGRNGKRFGMVKFRSMVVDADQRLAELQTENDASGPLFKMRNDPRVTSVGRWMRKVSMDEFPQLLNVIRGEMSLVGPRPPLPHEVEKYTEHHWRRLEVTPGMTGLWQVSGRSSLTFDEMVRLDLFYIENWSVGLDLTLLARTVPAVLFARGAY